MYSLGSVIFHHNAGCLFLFNYLVSFSIILILDNNVVFFPYAENVFIQVPIRYFIYCMYWIVVNQEWTKFKPIFFIVTMF